MKIRGRRECTECGTEWAYYETGSVECPDCGSLRSVGLDDERQLHTNTPVELDLAEARAAIADRPLREVASLTADAARPYYRQRGFIDAGDLLPLDQPFLTAAELRATADSITRTVQYSDAAKTYFLARLTDPPEQDRSRPVPPGLHAAYGLGRASAVRAYRRDLATWLAEFPDQPAAAVLERLRDHDRRINALDGDVDPETTDQLVAAARSLGQYLRGNESALAVATDRLDRLPSGSAVD